MRISGVRVGRVKTKEPNAADRAHRHGARDRRALRADPEGHARDPAAEDAARRDLRGAVARHARQSGKRATTAGKLRRRAGGRHGRSSTRSCARSTRRRAARFSTWFDQAGIAAQGNAEHLNDALALLTPFAEDTDEVLAVLRQQSGATQRFVRDTGYVFDALSERKGQLRDLIQNSNRTWQAIASRDAAARRHVPSCSRPSCARAAPPPQRLTRFANDTNPLVTQLRPAARELSPTLHRAGRAGAGPEGRVPGPRPAGARVQARPAGHGAGARQHAAAAAPARPVAARTSRRSSTTSASTSARSRRSSATTPRPRRAGSRASTTRRTSCTTSASRTR